MPHQRGCPQHELLQACGVEGACVCADAGPKRKLELEDIRRLDIKPGQILVVRVSHVPTQTDIDLGVPPR